MVWLPDIFFVFDDAGIITYFCPCYTFGKNAEAVGDSCCLCGLSYFVAPINLYTRTHIRGKVRDQKGIEVSKSDLLQRERMSLVLRSKKYLLPFD